MSGLSLRPGTQLSGAGPATVLDVFSQSSPEVKNAKIDLPPKG